MRNIIKLKLEAKENYSTFIIHLSIKTLKDTTNRVNWEVNDKNYQNQKTLIKLFRWKEGK